MATSNRAVMTSFSFFAIRGFSDSRNVDCIPFLSGVKSPRLTDSVCNTDGLHMNNSKRWV